MSVKLEIENLSDVQNALKLLGSELSEKVLLNINQVAAKIAQAEIKRSVPDGDNTKKSKNKLENNIKIKRAKGSKTGVWVGVTKRAFHARFVERGTTSRRTRGKGKIRPYRKANRGRVSGGHYIEKAHQRAYPKIIQYMNTNVHKVIQRALKRIEKKQKKQLGKS